MQVVVIALFIYLIASGNRRFMIMYICINTVMTLLLLVQDLYVQATLNKALEDEEGMKLLSDSATLDSEVTMESLREQM